MFAPFAYLGWKYAHHGLIARQRRIVRATAGRCPAGAVCYILQLLPNRSDADDVLQATNLVMWDKRSQFAEGTKFAAWAAKIAYYEVLTFRKRRGRERIRFDDTLVDQLAAEAASEAGQIDDVLQTLRRCMDKLNQQDRTLLEMQYSFDLRPRQIAERTGPIGRRDLGRHAPHSHVAVGVHRRKQSANAGGLTMSQSRLFAKLLENEITYAEREELNQLLRDDHELRRLYRKYMTLDAMLRWEIAPPLMSVSEEDRESADSPAGHIASEYGVSVPLIIVDPSPAGFTFVGSMAFSYMVATVVLCAMLLSAWAYRVTRQNAAPDGFAQNGPVGQEMESVARVTAAVDCKWDDPSEGTLAGAWVAVGRKYALPRD